MTDATRKLLEEAVALPLDQRKALVQGVLDSVCEDEGRGKRRSIDPYMAELVKRAQGARDGSRPGIPRHVVSERARKLLEEL